MKNLFIILSMLFIAACSTEEIAQPIQQEKPYTFKAWYDDGMLRISYQAKLVGYKIYVSPDKEHQHKQTQIFWSDVNNCAGNATSLYWHPTYVTLVTAEYSETITPKQ